MTDTPVAPTPGDYSLAERLVKEFRPSGWSAKEEEMAHAIARHTRAAVGEAERPLREQLRSIRDLIPMNYLQSHDQPGATGPTASLDLVGAMRAFSKDRWDEREKINRLTEELAGTGESFEERAPVLCSAFRTCTYWPGSRVYRMEFAFKTMDDMHKADEEWRRLRAG